MAGWRLIPANPPPAAEPPPVWLVGAERWPRALLRAELIERGYEASGFARLADLVSALPAAREPPVVIVLDLSGQALAPAALAALAATGIPVLAVAGATEAAAPAVRGFPWAALLRRPVTLGQIADAVARAAPGASRGRARPAGVVG